VPGGAFEAIDHLEVTKPENAMRTVEVHRAAFGKLGLEDAFERAIAVVVQPGVEFGNTDVVAYTPEAARALVATLGKMPQFVFEAHSTDYQTGASLAALVNDGFSILKVGPWLTFALREALYGLSHIAGLLSPSGEHESLPAAMERAMQASPANWQKYYPGTDAEQHFQRHFSFSDRIRYYWPTPSAQAALDTLMSELAGITIPRPLISQYLGNLAGAVEAGAIRPTARDLLIGSITRVLDIYCDATRQ
jgi:D-tagatose-bisphosphate aldolase class II non-catalytic subunit